MPRRFPPGAAAVLGVALAATLALAGCGPSPERTLSIVSGSENESLEPIVAAFCEAEGWDCPITYKGSVDIRLALEEEGFAHDAVWPAHSRWIDMGDRARRVRHAESIFRSPVAFGVRRSTAAALGLDRGAPTTADILARVKEGRLRFAMTSATQSNSGFSAYIAMLTALSGVPVVDEAVLERKSVRTRVRDLLRGVDRTAGSSGWLKDLYLKTAASGEFAAMVNYEAVLIEANQALEAAGQETLWLVYPADGVAVADSPLAFYPQGDAAGEKEDFFLRLQRHLLSPEVQRELAASGRRTGLAGGVDAPPGVFRAEWGIDPQRVLTGIRFPTPDVIDKALALYQELLRKPSLTALCLDYSGSMDGEGEATLEAALARLFDPAESRRLMIQAGAEDITILIPFSDRPWNRHIAVARGAGELPAIAAELAKLSAQGGTDIYACQRLALERLRAAVPEGRTLADYTPAVVTMTDGRSDGDTGAFATDWQAAGRIPVFGITFGDADRSQLDAVAELTRARVFDGTGDLGGAFRSARGYN